jgi:hypothetical protein
VSQFEGASIYPLSLFAFLDPSPQAESRKISQHDTLERLEDEVNPAEFRQASLAASVVKPHQNGEE